MFGCSLLMTLLLSTSIFCEHVTEYDWLLPYPEGQHGPRHSHRHVRDCQHIRYANRTHELYPVNTNNSLPIDNLKIFSKSFPSSYNGAYGHYAVAQNPLKTLSVLEPSGVGGCNASNPVRATVRHSAKQKKCYIAINGGFFNTHNASCLGNIVSDGRLVRDSGGIQNAHFGITKDGKIFTGYLSERDLIDMNFKELLGGVVWLVRNGESYVNASRYAECSDTQETGSLDGFINVISARTAIGHDGAGNIVIVQVDGKSYQTGINLWDFADFLIGLGVVNAINLDGGGSATFVTNASLANYPSDVCGDFSCEREVSTVVCIHSPDCDRCVHGNCVNGDCVCHKHWTGSSCEQLLCDNNNCSSHGVCTSDGCRCHAGWMGIYCHLSCPWNMYGKNCVQNCSCENGATCRPTDGACVCKAGYTGQWCEKKCSHGFHGKGCKNICFCPDSCTCHHVTGSCNTTLSQNLRLVSKCQANKIISERHLVPDQPDQYHLWLTSLIGLSVLAAFSLILNISLFCCILKSSKCERTATLTLNGDPQLIPILQKGSIPWSEGSGSD